MTSSSFKNTIAEKEARNGGEETERREILHKLAPRVGHPMNNWSLYTMSLWETYEIYLRLISLMGKKEGNCRLLAASLTGQGC